MDLTDGRHFVAVRHEGDSIVAHQQFDSDERVWLVRPDGYVAAHVSAQHVPTAIDAVLDRTSRFARPEPGRQA